MKNIRNLFAIYLLVLSAEKMYIRELKQTDAAAANLQISIQKDSRPSELSRPLTASTLNLNGNLPVHRRCVTLLNVSVNSKPDHPPGRPPGIRTL